MHPLFPKFIFCKRKSVASGIRIGTKNDGHLVAVRSFEIYERKRKGKREEGKEKRKRDVEKSESNSTWRLKLTSREKGKERNE